MDKKRPKYLALHQIKLPLPGIVSILHRISGALLFLSLPALLWLLQSSLYSLESYTQSVGLLQLTSVKLPLFILMWAFFHHFCAGIRYLLTDLHIGSSLAGARLGSRLVMVASILMTALGGIWLW